MTTAVRASAFTEPDRPKGLLIRFVTTGGSYVDVTGHGEHAQDNRWNCLGCGDTSRSPDQSWMWRIRPDANDHATACRAIPLT
ncbi:hypothetical protein ACFU5Z_08120 [Streptomyces sp. NPDC057521]|uniref:hypothetical protein n=1 Tax=Streptomyces sp. NPDC057521 TaxID=3346156 RepID=UPI0036C5482C